MVAGALEGKLKMDKLGAVCTGGAGLHSHGVVREGGSFIAKLNAVRELEAEGGADRVPELLMGPEWLPRASWFVEDDGRWCGKWNGCPQDGGDAGRGF